MLVEGWSLRYGGPGRRSRSGWRSRPGREGRYEYLRSRWSVAQRGMGPDRIVMPSPAFDDDLSLLQGVEDLSIQQLVPKRPRSPRWSGSRPLPGFLARPERPPGAAWKRSDRARTRAGESETAGRADAAGSRGAPRPDQ